MDTEKVVLGFEEGVSLSWFSVLVPNRSILYWYSRSHDRNRCIVEIAVVVVVVGIVIDIACNAGVPELLALFVL